VFPRSVQDVPVPSRDFEVRVERSIELRVVVIDGETRESLRSFNVELSRESVIDGLATTRPFRSASLYEEDGTWRVPVPVGRLVLFVETPDHRPFHGAVDVPPEPGPLEVLVEMSR